MHAPNVMTAEHDLVSTFGLLMEAYNSLEKQLGASLEERVGVPHQWFEVMLRISRAEDGLVAMGSLAEQVALTGGGVTRMVDRMVVAGLVVRVPCGKDRRVVYAALTPEGTAVLEKAVAVHDANLRSVLSDFAEAELDELEATLLRLRSARLTA
ncbi:MarR family winged helix-turn-helix transcriptional regulator [Intrasporangium sp.]|uniref:MarR family winged helix-turn-helix transcriptional regulator n=1 Tax=Intrasporangium sp. TaxID=1925024 RepID=UPI00293973D5|nr:MarR family transcriptional regulator [Intrasporangium sp.]MDV3223529.1 MarR family transcriptional regulator [Intrasporangium sp.]